MLLKLACCYYPTSVVFIDDNRSFLDNILLGFDENINTISFTEPSKAIEYLKNHALISFTRNYLKSLKDNDSLEGFNVSNVEHGYVDVDILNIHRIIYNPRRFSTAIVVVVDYTMPEMNGIELCRSLKEFPFKFVLITGDATLNNAIEAFNAGLIHQFIPKSHSDFIIKLQNTIYNLQEKQFAESCSTIMKNLSITMPTNLSDPVLNDFIKEFFKKNRIVEYYLINRSGCFLMAKSNGGLSWLVIKSEDEMAEYESAAIDNYGKEKIISEIRSREKVLFLNTEDDHVNVTVDNWENYLYPAEKLVGEYNTYYYSHVSQITNNDFFTDKIISYDMY